MAAAAAAASAATTMSRSGGSKMAKVGAYGDMWGDQSTVEAVRPIKYPSARLGVEVDELNSTRHFD